MDPVWELHKISASRSLRGPSFQIAPGPVGRGHDVLDSGAGFFGEKRAKLGKRQPAPEASLTPAPSKIERPKPKAKGKGKGKSDAPEESNLPAASN